MPGPKFTTWRKLISEVAETNGETLDDLTITLSDEELDVEFHDGYGGSEGMPFTAWSDKFVYFPAVYDGYEWAASVPRNPGGGPTAHIGVE